MPDCIPGVVRDSFGDVIFSNLPLLYCEYKGFGVPVPTDRYVVSDFYAIYAVYCHRELLDYIADKWVDILASVISLISLAISIVALLQVPPA